MSADKWAPDKWTAGERLAAIVAQEINDAPAAQLIKAATDDVLRSWAAKIREVGTAKGWSVWAAAFLDPDVPFIDTGMPSTETIVAELRRFDRAATLRTAADAINALPQDYECDPGRGDAAALLRRMATEVEKGTDTGHQPDVDESTPVHAQPYVYTDAQNNLLTVHRSATDASGTPYVWIEAEDLAIGGHLVSVWLPIGQGAALERALHAGAAFQFTDHTGDMLRAEPAEPWTPITLTRNPGDDEPGAVRVVILSSRLPELRAAIRAVVAEFAPDEPAACANPLPVAHPGATSHDVAHDVAPEGPSQ